MKKQIKKIMAILCVAIAIFIISVPVIAISETVDSEIAASDETNETDAEGSTESKAWPAAFAVGLRSSCRSNCNGYCNWQGIRRNFKTAGSNGEYTYKPYAWSCIYRNTHYICADRCYFNYICSLIVRR